MILENIQNIKKRIANACQIAGRDPKSVQLLLATKTISPETIAFAIQSGETLIAENRIQEVIQKYDALKHIPHTAHFIGHLQTNKVKYALKYGISCIQSVDNIGLVMELQKRLLPENRTMDILIQVNTSGEASKFGIVPGKALDFVKTVSSYSQIQIKGLMTIGALSEDTHKIRTCFQKLKSIQQEISTLQLANVSMETLSMGMSGDLEIAIEEGATIIRVGSAIFGSRS